MIAITPMPPTISATDDEHDHHEEEHAGELVEHVEDLILA